VQHWVDRECLRYHQNALWTRFSQLDGGAALVLSRGCAERFDLALMN
jgi:hypothetical protein